MLSSRSPLRACAVSATAASHRWLSLSTLPPSLIPPPPSKTSGLALKAHPGLTSAACLQATAISGLDYRSRPLFGLGLHPDIAIPGGPWRNRGLLIITALPGPFPASSSVGPSRGRRGVGPTPDPSLPAPQAHLPPSSSSDKQGPFCLLFPLPGAIFPQIFANSLPSDCHVSVIS